jgi:uncharacterized RDD family membrane protein YckC
VSVHEPTHTHEAQLEAIRRLRGEAPPAAAAVSLYAGLVTRTIAIALDSAIVWASAAAVGVTVGLGLSLLHLPSSTRSVIAAIGLVLATLWSVGYFVFFWSSTGQTPGSRLMGIAVLDAHERGALKPRRALLRCVGIFLAALPLLAGFWMMLWDGRGRCLQDRLARTVVVNLPR